MFSQVETQMTISKLHNVWHPQIVYDVHQQGTGASRMFVPPWMDPVEPNIDAILMQETNMIGTAMAADLTARQFMPASEREVSALDALAKRGVEHTLITETISMASSAQAAPTSDAATPT